MKINDELYWSKLDNTAKIYPAVSNMDSANVFRMSTFLKEDVDPNILDKAVNKALESMPIFKVKLRRGLFWYYFEANHEDPIIQGENSPPCIHINKKENNHYLFKVLYFKNKLSLEVFHVLGDGTGLIQFLNTILYFYLKELYPEDISDDFISETLDSDALDEDAFNKHKNAADTKNSFKLSKAYTIAGTYTPHLNPKAIIVKVPVKEFIKEVKSKQITVGVYIVALMAYAIYIEGVKKDVLNRPVTICMPTNLRAFFQSSTARNFFACIYPSIDFSQELTFDDVILLVQKEFEKYLNKEFLAQRIKYFTTLEQNPGFRVVPLFIKNIALQMAYSNSEANQTTVLSSLGKIEFGSGIDKFVDDVEIIVSPSRSNPIKTLVFTYKDDFCMDFTTIIEDTDIIKYIVRHLTDLGMKATVYTNEVE